MDAHAMPSLLHLDGALHVTGRLDVINTTMALDDVDLFGDPVMDTALDTALNLPPQPAVSKQLQQRLDELRARGCCQ